MCDRSTALFRRLARHRQDLRHLLTGDRPRTTRARPIAHRAASRESPRATAAAACIPTASIRPTPPATAARHNPTAMRSSPTSAAISWFDHFSNPNTISAARCTTHLGSDRDRRNSSRIANCRSVTTTLAALPAMMYSTSSVSSKSGLQQDLAVGDRSIRLWRTRELRGPRNSQVVVQRKTPQKIAVREGLSVPNKNEVRRMKTSIVNRRGHVE